MENYLYIPISVKGLMVGKAPDGVRYFGAFYDYTKLEGDSLGKKVSKEYEYSETPDAGIHLHWSLPDAFTQGRENENKSDIIFPDLPDRWLVSRIWKANEKLFIKNFLVISNFAAGEIDGNNIGSPSCPDFGNSKKPYIYVGKTFVLGTEPRSITYLDSLKAVDLFDSTYTAYYPASRNIFGFHDDMTDNAGNPITNVNVSYCVSGWYENGADPLKHISSLSEFKEDMKWNIPEDTDLSSVLSLCHGMLLNVDWKDKNYDYGTSASKEPPKLSVGNTSAEALSAQDNNSADSEGERLFTHLLTGNHQLFDSPKSLINAENALHANRFSYSYSKEEYFLSPKDNSEGKTLSEKAQYLLLKLNDTNARLLTALKESSHLKQSIYDLWIKHELLSKEKMTLANVKLRDACKKSISEVIEEVDVKKAEILQLEKEKTAFETDLQRCAAPDFELNIKNEKRYCEPKNIVLLLKGENRDYSHGFDGRFSIDGLLKVRTSAISQFTIKKQGKIKNDVTIIPTDLLAAITIPDKYPAFGISELIGESVLLNPGFASCLAMVIIKKLNLNEESDKADIESIIKALQLSLNLSVNSTGFSSRELGEAAGMNNDFPDKVAVEYWKQPWNPLFLLWECQYLYDENLVLENPKFTSWEEEGSDYTLKNTNSISKMPHTIRGKAVITPHAAKMLADSLEKTHGKINGAENIKLLSQELGGINESLILRSMSQAFPPFRVAGGDISLAGKAAKAMADFSPDFCDYDKLFSPLRAGVLEFKKVWIADSFGFVQELDCHNIAISENLRGSNNSLNSKIILPPRIIQASRLVFDWINNRESSPIYGFIVPNMLENNLYVFDEYGIFLGFFQAVKNNVVPVLWKKPWEIGGGSSEIPKDINADLYAFLNEIYSLSLKGENVVEELVSQINASFYSVNPADAILLDPMNLLFGRPLALCKGSLKLETMKKVLSYKTIKANPAEKEYNDVNIENMLFPVRIGQLNNHDDGTVGFFINGDYKTFHLSNGNKTKSAYFSSDSHTYMQANGEPVEISILADPIGEINFQSFILPVLSERIKQNLVSKALDSLYHTVFAAPVLTCLDEIRIPVPELEGKKWGFLSYSKDGVFTETEHILSASEPANVKGVKLTAAEGWLKLGSSKEYN